METISIKIYKANGEKILLDGVSVEFLKKEIDKKNYDGTWRMKNGDIVKKIK